jgi:hypothetical protein
LSFESLKRYPISFDRPQFVIPGLDPGIHVDGWVKPGHDAKMGRFDMIGYRSGYATSCAGGAADMQ